MNRERNDYWQEPIVLPYAHPLPSSGAAVAATTTYKLFTAKRRMHLDVAEYIPSATLAAHATDYWTIAILKGSTVIASWSTAVAGQGGLTASTPVLLVPSATSDDLNIAAGDVISVRVTKAGAVANLAAGHGTLHFTTT